jgi:hypothetical protein
MTSSHRRRLLSVGNHLYVIFLSINNSRTNDVANGTDISCCSSTGGTLSASQLHPACLPIAVRTNDKFFNVNTTTITTCMNFVRSIAGPRLDCSLGYADQVTLASSLPVNILIMNRLCNYC